MPAAAPEQPTHPPRIMLERPGQPLHVLIGGASDLSEDCAQAMLALDAPGRVPHLKQLLALLNEPNWLKGDEYSPATPHEQVWAHALGWQVSAEGMAPWAAHWARADGLMVDGRAWGLLTPGHWLMGREHLTVLHPNQLSLGAEESKALLDSARELFESEGWSLHWGAPTRWYACHESLADMPTASLDRVVGRNPDMWLLQHPQARLIRRLQAEVQMLWYEHPINDARSERGALSVNSFWLSGCGMAQAEALSSELLVLDTPLQALLQGEQGGSTAWLAAWDALDAQTLPQVLQAVQQGRDVRLTLCGERHALTLSRRSHAQWWAQAWQQVRPRFMQRTALPSSVLGAL